MAIAAIFILTLVAILLLWIGLSRQDVTIAIFSGFFFVILGIMTITNGYEEIAPPYTNLFGILFLFGGLYVISRAGLEFIIGGGGESE